MKLKMPRSEFVGLINHAIARTSGLTNVQREKLREVARTTKTVGNNFNSAPACPAGQAFGVRTWPCRYSPAVVDFAYAYDDLVARKLRHDDCTPITVEVEDAPGA